MKYDGIFFDSGGTIYGFSGEASEDPSHSQVAARMAERAYAALSWLGIATTEQIVADHITELNQLARTSPPGYTEETLVRSVFERLGEEPRNDHIVYVTGVVSGPRFRSWLFPGVAETLSALSTAGIYMGIIANTHVPGWVMDRNFRGVEVGQHFQERIYSGDEAVEKPDPRIFRIAEDRAQMAGKRLIYMGDRVDKDVAGAEAAGWDSILFRSTESSSDGRATYEIDDWAELPAILT
ncbi:MAG: HAD family hydrolase [Gemmatimonadetes bacterium]|jgi:HAD superfamily hydrolase (TIGR01549 family)|nr:HAD family hydrolase [Gemmatimonadota bacterium]MBT5059484.1 HAD family hydrolase [Gemmatimonadota bacterium]MBT5146791.1 HAD family hydrolase [Gemmatimonadota bacterium]MBT5590080.1 HAD family hydrolase [Gemmatimonadota bacterium]MBT5961725.1 HAD family hydrolase [Gemmatimonadota bacterium]